MLVTDASEELLFTKPSLAVSTSVVQVRAPRLPLGLRGASEPGKPLLNQDRAPLRGGEEPKGLGLVFVLRFPLKKHVIGALALMCYIDCILMLPSKLTMTRSVKPVQLFLKKNTGYLCLIK